MRLYLRLIERYRYIACSNHRLLNCILVLVVLSNARMSLLRAASVSRDPTAISVGQSFKAIWSSLLSISALISVVFPKKEGLCISRLTQSHHSLSAAT